MTIWGIAIEGCFPHPQSPRSDVFCVNFLLTYFEKITQYMRYKNKKKMRLDPQSPLRDDYFWVNHRGRKFSALPITTKWWFCVHVFFILFLNKPPDIWDLKISKKIVSGHHRGGMILNIFRNLFWENRLINTR